MNELPNTEIVKSEGEFLGAKIGFLMHLKPVRSHHRIIDDRIEKSIKGRRIGHRLCRSGVKGEGGRAGTALAHPPTTPIPHARPGVGYICGLWVLPQIVPNSSSLYTLFYSVIYNSVGHIQTHK